MYETIPFRAPNFDYPRIPYFSETRFPQYGIFEIPSTLIKGFRNVLEKRKKNNEDLFYKESPFLTFKFKFKKFDHEFRRFYDSSTNGLELIFIYKYGALKDFKIYYHDFIKFYEDNESEGKIMFDCFKVIYTIFKKN